MLVDHTLSPLQNVINQINETNGTSFTLDDFVLKDLLQIDTSGDITVKNSSLTVEATLNNEFYGTQTLNYRRLYIEEIVKSTTYTLQAGDTLQSIIDLIADRYKLIPSELKFEEGAVLPTAAGESKTLQLLAIDGSWVYLGGVDLTIRKL
ncbi:hypothetical protein [Streptomyces sp. CHB9.2]|uniref:DUF7941 domain-family protein n=1 Tax=Streptomyces sp. CHB9.2 TaxID=2841670 RepID=UPI002095C076|nr:hypothetical protein [Streptomyces sp. CHB9.2]MCO6704718.1 hypothetical protein [Streptomyces sp. CHB9.2]